MKVLDLQCGQQHTFEGWFASEDDFQGQMARGLVECPLCGDAHITKMLSAPRINLGKSQGQLHDQTPATSAALDVQQGSFQLGQSGKASNKQESSANMQGELAVQPAQSLPPQRSPMSAELASMMQAVWMDMARHVMANTEDVGGSFASEARKIHYGETKERAIRGQATHDETMELIEEGIDVMPLPIPQSLKNPLN